MGTRPTRFPVTNRGSTAHIDQLLWENLTKVMGSRIEAIIQAQQFQKQPIATHIEHAGRREFYNDCALTALVGYAQVYIESGIPIIWVKFQMSKECSDNRKELMVGMMY